MMCSSLLLALRQSAHHSAHASIAAQDRTFLRFVSAPSANMRQQPLRNRLVERIDVVDAYPGVIPLLLITDIASGVFR